jgi:transposase
MMRERRFLESKGILGVDTQGLPHTIHITPANVADKVAAAVMIKKYKANLKKVKNILVDGAYTGEPFANSIKESINATVEIVKRSYLHKFTTIAKRWVIERSFSWLEKCKKTLEELREKSFHLPCHGSISVC